MFKPGAPLYSYEIIRESGENVMYINYLGANFTPSLIESPIVMARTLDNLKEDSNISRIVFVQQRNYSHDFTQVKMLIEVSNLFDFLINRERIVSPEKLSHLGKDYYVAYAFLNHILNEVLKQDPILAYRELRSAIFEQKALLGEGGDNEDYIRVLEKVEGYFEDLLLVKKLKPSFDSYSSGDRDIYSEVFRADAMPNFTFTRMVARIPDDAEIIKQYEIAEGPDKSLVTIFERPNKAKLVYHLSPPEYSLNEDHHMLLNLARQVLIEHRPSEEEFNDPERTRQVFLNVARDLLSDLAQSKNLSLNYMELGKLANILVRHTIGFGILEVLLQDENLQDIVINAPVSLSPVFVRHNEFDECVTNLIPSQEDADSWAAKFRMISGRALDEANPILDTNLELKNASARVAIIQQPLSAGGIAYALRRHRSKPWTLPLFIKNKMIDSLGAGLLSFMVDGARTMLVAGTRSSGKCVDGDTLIQLSDGGIKKIRDLVGEKKKDIEDGEIFSPKEKFGVKSLEGMKISEKEISDVWKRISPEKVIQIRTRSGKQIITTKEHPYFIYEGGIKNKRADSLEKGNLIVSPRNLKFDLDEQKINLKDNNYLVNEGGVSYVLKGGTNSQEVLFPKTVTKELAEIIGMIIGDGHLDECKLEFHNQSIELRERYIKLLKMFGVKYRIFDSHTTTVVQVTSRMLNRLLRDVFEIPFGKKSDKVVIPQIILKSNNNVLARFLRGYFDCDGYVPKDKRDLEIVSASKMMGEHLKLALLRFGITPFLKIKKINGENYYRILIRGSFVNDYAKNIGFFHPFKKNRLEQISCRDFIENSNTDVIPEGNEIIKKLRKELRVCPQDVRIVTGKDYWAYENDKYRVTRSWFRKLVYFYKNRFDNLKTMGEDIVKLKNFVNFNYTDYLENINKLRSLLGVSYSFLAGELGMSEAGIRKILKNKKISNYGVLIKTFGLFRFLKERYDAVFGLKGNGLRVDCIPELVKEGVVSYAEIGRECNIPESSLKYYCCGNSVPVERKEVIERCLIGLKIKMLFSLEKSFDLIDNISIISESINFGMILANMRNELGISNEEFAKHGISVGSVTNFFCGHSKPSIETLKAMVGCIMGVYESCVNDGNFELIKEADKLASSDIYWDEILSVEEIDKVDDYVYDLTVPEAHNFVANGIVAHNTSLLGSLLLEIMPNHRVITIEDSVTKDALMVVRRNGLYEKISIGNLIDEQVSKYGFIDLDGREKSFNLEGIEVFSFNKDGRIVLSKPSKFIRHKNTKDIYEVETASGKIINVTKDHSLFSLDVDNLIKPIKPINLREDNFIAIPRKLNFGNKRDFIDILPFLGDIEKKIYVLGAPINNYFDGKRKELFDFCSKLNYKKATIQSWTRNKVLPYEVYNKLREQIGEGDFFIKSFSSSKIIPTKIMLDEDFLNFLGLWLADGCYGKNSVLISVQEEENREVVCRVAKKLGMNVKVHSDEFTFMLNSGLFREVMERVLLFSGNSYTKKIPNWIYGLSNKQVGWMLRGFYSGDGCAIDKEIVFSSCSKDLIKDISTLLLRFGIILRYSSVKRKDKCTNCRIGDGEMIKLYKKNIGFLVDKKRERLDKLCSRKSNHDTSDIIPLSLEVKNKLSKEIGGDFNFYDYVTRNNNLGIRKLRSFVDILKGGDLKEKLTRLVGCDIYWDKVKSVRKINYKGYVYDISVPGDENFICENILAHNTLELPVSAMRKLDYDILSMKVRSALAGESTEVAAEEGIRASLRLGDSSLIVGEIRSAEAKALYEAMRVGALANVVAGTIHGGSPYSVFDRVVNDLGVPVTSFKATDLIVVANPIKSPDGLHSWRRVLQITEVRKHWTKDPLTEGGFVDLMKYDVEEDILKPSEDLINGDSEIIKDIASNVKGWAGNWDAVWDNIILRQKIKQEVVDFAEKMKQPELLEAEFTVKSNNAFHQISDEVSEEIGLPTSEVVFPKWKRWLEKESKRVGL